MVRRQLKGVIAPFLGIIAALIFGFSVGLLWTDLDNFTSTQTKYIDGVVKGVEFRPTPRAKDRCVAELYPDQPLMLAGCIDAVEGNPWRMPAL